ncbi:hypothetical protein OH76DRAFT_868442 [Lentinus brumalis]|uniref:Uncharacterized protein n=1 Tax=Lentinus brumalis TaxID=2498619 RepID=A0A371DRG4_9APHY|nr:hypothetical protein OH76DRAFT_868442 [Polyporus brumalis]
MASPLPLRLALPSTVADVVHGPIASLMRTFMDFFWFSRPHHDRSGSRRWITQACAERMTLVGIRWERYKAQLHRRLGIMVYRSVGQLGRCTTARSL